LENERQNSQQKIESKSQAKENVLILNRKGVMTIERIEKELRILNEDENRLLAELQGRGRATSKPFFPG
jgi:hypothetical protein